MARVSIIVTSYNYEAFIGETIQSCLDQTHDDVEIIVVDDGSKDNSRAVIERFDTVKKIFKPNGGESSAVRAGLAECTGDIVMILDSDDVLLPHAAKTIVENWRPGVPLVQFALTKINNEGAVLGRYPDEPFLHGKERDFVLKHGYIPSSPTTGNAFSREHITHAFEYNKDRDKTFADGYLIFTAPLYGEIVSLEESLGLYRIHGANASQSAGTNLRRVKTMFETDMAHRIGLAQHAEMVGLGRHKPEEFLGPYSWRAALLMNKGYPGQPETAGYTTAEIVSRGVRRFWTAPGIPFARRLKNIALMVVLAVGPGALARRMLPAS